MPSLYLPLEFDPSHGAPPDMLGHALLWFCSLGRDPRNEKNLLDGFDYLSNAEKVAMWAVEQADDGWTFDPLLPVDTLVQGVTSLDGVWWETEDGFHIWMSWRKNLTVADGLPYIRWRVYGPGEFNAGTNLWVHHLKFALSIGFIGAHKVFTPIPIKTSVKPDFVLESLTEEKLA